MPRFGSFGTFRRGGLFSLLLLAALLLLSPFRGEAQTWVALFPEQALGACGADAQGNLEVLLSAQGLSSQAEQVFPQLGGAVLQLEEDQKDRILQNLPGTVLVPGDITFHHCKEEKPVSGNTPDLSSQEATPWHITWAENGHLTRNIPDASWSSVVVAVLDTGLNAHEQFVDATILWDLSYNAVAGTSGTPSSVHDDQGHGTEVTGTIIGKTTGVTPKMPVIPVKCADNTGTTSTVDLTESVDYLLGLLSGTLQGRKMVINFSYATKGNASSPNDALEDYFLTLLQRIDEAGVLFVSSAGNSSLDVDQYYIYPTRLSYRNLLSLGSTNEEGLLASEFSNYGSRTVDACAPGNAIVTTNRDGESTPPVNGTSFSSPIAAAISGVLWIRDSSLANWQIRNVLLNATYSPLWLASSLGSASALPFISGGRMAPEKFEDLSFLATARGVEPKALHLEPSDSDAGGGCAAGLSVPSWILLTLPLLFVAKKRY